DRVDRIGPETLPGAVHADPPPSPRLTGRISRPYEEGKAMLVVVRRQHRTRAGLAHPREIEEVAGRPVAHVRVTRAVQFGRCWHHGDPVADAADQLLAALGEERGG